MVLMNEMIVYSASDSSKRDYLAVGCSARFWGSFVPDLYYKIAHVFADWYNWYKIFRLLATTKSFVYSINRLYPRDRFNSGTSWYAGTKISKPVLFRLALRHLDQSEPLDDITVFKMFFDDLGHVVRLDLAVPDSFGIDEDGNADRAKSDRAAICEHDRAHRISALFFFSLTEAF